MNKYEAIKKVVDCIDEQTDNIRNADHLSLGDYPSSRQVVERINDLDKRGVKKATFIIETSLIRIERNGTLDFMKKGEKLSRYEMSKCRSDRSDCEINVEWE